MIRTWANSYLLLLCIILSACGGGTASKQASTQNAEIYTNDGLLAFAEDDNIRAQHLLNKALFLYQGLDNQHGVLLSHINLAEVALTLNEYSTCQRHLEEAAFIAKRTSQADIQLRITLLSSVNALKQNKITLAETTLHTLLPEFEKKTPGVIPNNIQLVAIANRTKIAFILKQDEELWTHRYAKALKKSAIKNHSLQASLLRFQATLLQQESDFLQAEVNFKQALVEYKSIPSRSGIAATLSELGQLSVIENQWQDASDYFNRAIAVYRYLKNVDKVSQLTENLAKVELELKNVNSLRNHTK